MERTVATILSVNYSGSHFLSLILGSHSRARHLGEIRYLRRWSKSYPRPCHVCQEPTRCPVIRGITPENISQAYEIIFSNFDDPNLNMLVDNSKKVYWAERFVHSTPYEMKYIHLIRDPRALVRRWMVTYNTLRKRIKVRARTARTAPPKSWSMLVAPSLRVYLFKWLHQNKQISDFISRYGLDALTVTYHDLAKHSEKSVIRICEWLGLEYEPSQLEYWNFPHHGTQKPTYEWIKKQKTRHFDARWKTFLEDRQQHDILADPKVSAYLRELGVVAMEDGLTHSPLTAAGV